MYKLSRRLKMCKLLQARIPNHHEPPVWTMNHKLVDIIVVRPKGGLSRQTSKKLVRTPRQTSFKDGLHKHVSVKATDEVVNRELSYAEERLKRDVCYDENRYPTYESWLEGSPHPSEEFDTDLEEDDEKYEEENIEERLETPGGEEAEQQPSDLDIDIEKEAGPVDAETREEQPPMSAESARKQSVVPGETPAYEDDSPSFGYTTAHSTAPTTTTDTFDDQSPSGESLTGQSVDQSVKGTVEQAQNIDLPVDSLDPTGKRTYIRQCRILGVIPATSLLRNLGKRSLILCHHYLGKEAAKALALALKDNTVTEVLDLCDNCFKDEGACYLANMMEENCFIDHLDLSKNCIHSTGALAISRMLEINTTLKVLKLSGNQLKDVDATLFIEGLKNNQSLTYLDLSHNKFTEKGGEILAKILSTNESLLIFDLSWNCLRGKGAIAIAKAIRVNTKLEVFNLSWNGFFITGAAALQGALVKNKTLRVLDLSNNRITHPAAVKLAAGLKKNTGLDNLTLDLNPLGNDGVEVLLKAVLKNQNLKLLSLEDMNISKQNQKLIREVEEERQMIVLNGEVGEYHTNKTAATLIKLFSEFALDPKNELLSKFEEQDWDHTDRLTVNQLRDCLIEAGFRMTNRQLDLLVNKIDFPKSGRIKYRELLSGDTLLNLSTKLLHHGVL